jgi:hypothetical protein
MARPRIFQADEKVRLNLEVSKSAHEQLLRLQKQSAAASLSDMARRAFALFDLVQEHAAKGGKLVFRHADGSEEILKVL